MNVNEYRGYLMHVHEYKFYIHTYILTCSLRSLVKYRVEHKKKNWYPQAGM